MKSVNIEYLGDNTSPAFMVYDEETGDPLTFIKSLEIFVDIEGYKCTLTRFVKNENGLFGDKTESEDVRIREIRMETHHSLYNYYEDKAEEIRKELNVKNI